MRKSNSTFSGWSGTIATSSTVEENLRGILLRLRSWKKVRKNNCFTSPFQSSLNVRALSNFKKWSTFLRFQALLPNQSRVPYLSIMTVRCMKRMLTFVEGYETVPCLQTTTPPKEPLTTRQPRLTSSCLYLTWPSDWGHPVVAEKQEVLKIHQQQKGKRYWVNGCDSKVGKLRFSVLGWNWRANVKCVY